MKKDIFILKDPLPGNLRAWNPIPDHRGAARPEYSTVKGFVENYAAVEDYVFQRLGRVALVPVFEDVPLDWKVGMQVTTKHSTKLVLREITPNYLLCSLRAGYGVRSMVVFDLEGKSRSSGISDIVRPTEKRQIGEKKVIIDSEGNQYAE